MLEPSGRSNFNELQNHQHTKLPIFFIGEIYDSIQDLKTKNCAFVNLPEKASEHQHAVTSEVMAECVWTKPQQPCEVEFIERTPRRRLRHAEFRRLLPRSGEK